MNPLAITEHFALPEGVAMDKQRQRTSALIALALPVLVPVPTQAIDGSPRDYFFSQVAGIRDVMFKINEVVPFDVDRALECGYALWNRRYEIALKPSPHMLFGTGPFAVSLATVIPELDSLGCNQDSVDRVISLLKHCTAPDVQ